MSNRYGYNAITGREHTLKYGFSPLHQTINAFKWLNKAGQYRDVKNWQARGDENQASVKEWTRKMSVMYKKRLGLTVFATKHGYGSSNTGKFDLVDSFFFNFGKAVWTACLHLKKI